MRKQKRKKALFNKEFTNNLLTIFYMKIIAIVTPVNVIINLIVILFVLS